MPHIKKTIAALLVTLLLFCILPVAALAAEAESSFEALAAPTPTKIVLSSNAKTVLLGQSFTLTAKVLPAGASQSVKWTSSKKNVAIVTSKGVIKAVGLGKTTITIVSNAKKSVYKTFSLTVKSASPTGTFKDTSPWYSGAYSPYIKLQANGKFTFRANLYEGMGTMTGTFTRSGSTIVCTVKSCNFKGFIGDDVKSFKFTMKDAKTLVYKGRQIGVTTSGNTFKL